MLSRIIRVSASKQAKCFKFTTSFRSFSDAVATQMDASKKPAEERSIMEHNEIVGADINFNKSKHGYVLDFPWNFEEVINEFEADYSM